MTRARRTALTVAGALLLATALGVVIACFAWAPLDRIVTTHWGADGRPNGWGPAWIWPLNIGILGVLLAAVVGVFGFIRFRAPSGTASPALPLRDGEIVAWTGRVRTPAWLLVLLIVLVVLFVAGGVIGVLSVGWIGWPAFLAAGLLLLSMLLLLGFRASAGPTGFAVRSLIGWPRFRVRAEDLVRAGVVHVDPMADFGGWGMRWVPGADGGRWGIVTRRGEGLEVVRRGGRSIVVTVDDAATAAAVLETYALHSPPRRASS